MELGLPLMLGKPHLQPYVFPLPCFGSWVVWEVGPGSFGAHPTPETRRRLKLLQFRPSGRGQLPGPQRLNGLGGDVRLFGPGEVVSASLRMVEEPTFRSAAATPRLLWVGGRGGWLPERGVVAATESRRGAQPSSAPGGGRLPSVRAAGVFLQVAVFRTPAGGRHGPWKSKRTCPPEKYEKNPGN